MEELEELKRELMMSEVNRKGAEQANQINYNLRMAETEKLNEIYRILTPEKAPWGPVSLGNGVTCSPYLLGELPRMIKELMEENARLKGGVKPQGQTACEDFTSSDGSENCSSCERSIKDHSIWQKRFGARLSR